MTDHFKRLSDITGAMKVDPTTKCMICGKSDFSCIGELADHMHTHKEFVSAMEKIFSNYADILRIDLR